MPSMMLASRTLPSQIRKFPQAAATVIPHAEARHLQPGPLVHQRRNQFVQRRRNQRANPPRNRRGPLDTKRIVAAEAEKVVVDAVVVKSYQCTDSRLLSDSRLTEGKGL
jgi:hypothetical protein